MPLCSCHGKYRALLLQTAYFSLPMVAVYHVPTYLRTTRRAHRGQIVTTSKKRRLQTHVARPLASALAAVRDEPSVAIQRAQGRQAHGAHEQRVRRSRKCIWWNFYVLYYSSVSHVLRSVFVVRTHQRIDMLANDATHNADHAHIRPKFQGSL